ncbi:hypothetical protein [Streptomyces gilvosporeus]|uniref:hypothetical protein n=1 Tax=Streptomyces gilvosporeus TaxID=553510 RepID=UPI00193959C4|nr:hypothetical protein [Streptomyces gilvosporeus]
MARTDVPAQPGEPEGGGRLRKTPTGPEAPPPLLPTPPGASEATRLLCAGTYLDETFRDEVIDELYVHEERFAAPSSGIDAARVLAHALRARRLQLAWAGAILLLWIVALPLSSWVAALYFFPIALMALGRFVRRLTFLPPWLSVVGSFVLRWYGRISLLLFVVALLVGAFGGGLAGLGRLPLPSWPSLPTSDSGYSGYSTASTTAAVGADDPYTGSYDVPDTGGALGNAFPLWVALLLLPAVAALVALQRGQFARALHSELSEQRFPDVMSDPAERFEGLRFQRLRDLVRAEQHGPLVMYRDTNPFCGAGQPFKIWSLTVELNPRTDRTAEPLDNAAILERIVPLVAALRVPSPHGSPEVAAAVRDRLRALEIEECVFLPAQGLKARTHAPYAPPDFAHHRAEAVEEGGERRRHLLRIRVGGWREGVVVTVFVRVHTQGGMLMLEVAPHVLWPLRQLFQDADRIAHQYRHHHHFGKAVWALAATPRSAGAAVMTLLRGLASVWRLATDGHGSALPEGPALSVRELGSYGESSLFQDMDVARYLETIQQRVAAGVTTALRAAGYQTEEFEQRVVNVAKGGVYVESAQGAVGIGDHNTITHNTGTARSGTDGKGPK